MQHIPANLRETRFSGGQWFEEDCDWAIPYHYLGLGALDEENHALLARETLRRVHNRAIA